jgi:hypothetical protein
VGTSLPGNSPNFSSTIFGKGSNHSVDFAKRLSSDFGNGRYLGERPFLFYFKISGNDKMQMIFDPT